MLLIALVIIGMLMKTMLQQYGLTGTAQPATRGTPLDPMMPDATVTTPAPMNAIERARGVEAQVQQQAVENAKRIDDALK